MSLGDDVVEELRRRKLLSALRYADIQRLRAIDDADTLRTVLSGHGCRVGEHHVEPSHFAEIIEILLLHDSRDRVASAALFFGPIGVFAALQYRRLEFRSDS